MQHQSPQALFVETIIDAVKENYSNAKIVVQENKKSTLLNISGVKEKTIHLPISMRQSVPEQFPYVNEALPVRLKLGKEHGFTDQMLKIVSPVQQRTAQPA